MCQGHALTSFQGVFRGNFSVPEWSLVGDLKRFIGIAYRVYRNKRFPLVECVVENRLYQLNDLIQ